jgi:hypothetical protein
MGNNCTALCGQTTRKQQEQTDSLGEFHKTLLPCASTNTVQKEAQPAVRLKGTSGTMMISMRVVSFMKSGRTDRWPGFRETMLTCGRCSDIQRSPDVLVH